jgi:predicted transcriptional regulator of viral defense system
MLCSMYCWPAVSKLAEEQWGLVTRQQAAALGMAWTTLSRNASTGRLERVGHGVYRVSGTPPPTFLELRVAWLQLQPGVPAWRRTVDQGVVSYRSAAALYGIGDLPADVHEFTLAVRRQSRRPDVRLHRGRLKSEWITEWSGLPVTRASQIAVDLLDEGVAPDAVAAIVSAAIRGGYDDPRTVASRLATLARRFGFAPGHGADVLGWLLDLSHDSQRGTWLAEASPVIAGRHR